MADNREISVDEVTGNTLAMLDELDCSADGYAEAAKAVDILLKNQNEAEQIQSNERIEMAKIEAEKAQQAEENRLREKEINASKIDSVLKSTVIAVVIGEISYHVGMKVVGKFEETGVYRSLLSKTWVGRLGRRK